LVRERHQCACADVELRLQNHVHQLDACSQIAGGAKEFEAQHRPGRALDSAVVLLDNVVDVFDLPRGDLGSQGDVDLVDRGLVCAALVYGDFLRQTVRTRAFSKKHLAAAMSHCAVSRKSKAFPILSTPR
jgi:hypothetical protein